MRAILSALIFLYITNNIIIIKPQSELETSGKRTLGILNMFTIVFNGFRVNT